MFIHSHYSLLRRTKFSTSNCCSITGHSLTCQRMWSKGFHAANSNCPPGCASL